MKQKKPYLRQKSSTKILAIFNTVNAPFAAMMIAYCHSNGIGCILEKTTPSGHMRYAVSGNSRQIATLKQYLNKEYAEFCNYNKELSKFAK